MTVVPFPKSAQVVSKPAVSTGGLRTLAVVALVISDQSRGLANMINASPILTVDHKIDLLLKVAAVMRAIAALVASLSTRD